MDGEAHIASAYLSRTGWRADYVVNRNARTIRRENRVFPSRESALRWLAGVLNDAAGGHDVPKDKEPG